MANIAGITGVQEVVRNLKLATVGMAMGCSRGLRLAGLKLQRESQRLVPVNFGVLKASAFTRSSGAGFDTVVIVGYTARYALYVHELVQMKLKGQPRPKGRGKYWDPQGRGQAKFLEEPARRMANELRNTIKEQMNIL